MTAPHLAPGTVLSGRSYNFSIQALVGHSGAAATFRALSSAGGEAMIKVYDPAVRQRPDITGAMERVYAETMQLPGDVIVHVLEAGYDPSTGAPFSATAFVQLPSVAQLVARRPLSPAEVSGMLKSIARGLDAAHIRQVSHHALKPTNVFLGGAPNYEARLTDFGGGLVRIAVPTHEGYALSAPWLAPEQAQQGQQAGPAADIFSAALVAFFALTGRSFWRSCQGQAPDLNAWQQELLGGRAVASLRSSEIGIPMSNALDPVFARALAVDPRQRYRTVGEFAVAFDAAINQRSESGQTVAFPSVGGMLEGPPQPGTAPYNPGAAPNAPPTQVSPTGGGQPPQQGQWAGGSASGANPAAQPQMDAAGMAAPAGAGSAAAMTMVPMGIDRPRARASKAVPIFLGLTAALLIGGAAAAFVFLGKKDPTAPPVNTTGAITVPTGSAVATATDTPTATTAAPTASTTAAAVETPTVQLKIVCVPGCDAVKLDDKAIEEITKPAKVEAGKHTLSATKDGFNQADETVEVEITGSEAKVTFTKDGTASAPVAVKDLTKPVEHRMALVLTPKAPSSSAPTGTAKPTGSGSSSGTKTTTKPPCKSAFSVNCKK